MSSPSAPHVLLGVSGGIAVYKAVEIMRALQKRGAEVRVVMTKAAQAFVGTATFRALSGFEVLIDVFTNQASAIPHIDYAEWADIALLAPATAESLEALAHGRAGNALSATFLATPAPILVAPAMNVHMWEKPATQRNIAQLKADGVTIVEPAQGVLACGDVGAGKLATVEKIADGAWQLLTAGGKTVAAAFKDASTQLDLLGKRVVITAGPTHEAIDAVRYIANKSTGKMGFALAKRAASRGAEVTLVAGPVALATPAGVKRIDVVSTAEMYEATLSAFLGADLAICTAAVADWTPVAPQDHKMKKGLEPLNVLELKETPDILATLAKRKSAGQTVIGFAAETNNVLEFAAAKRAKKGVDLIVANDVSRPESSFGADTNHVFLVGKDITREVPLAPKEQVADVILDAFVHGMRSDVERD